MKPTAKRELQSATDSYEGRKRELQKAGDRFGAAYERLEAAKLAAGILPPPKPEPTPEPEPYELPAADVAAIEAMTVLELCHEWHLVKAKINFDIAALPEERSEADNERIDQLCTEANERTATIEAALGERELTTPRELFEVLKIVLANEDEYHGGGDWQEAGMLDRISERLHRMAYPPRGGFEPKSDADEWPRSNLFPLAEVERVRFADRLNDIANKMGAVEMAIRGVCDGETFASLGPNISAAVGGIYENINDLRTELTEMSGALVVRLDGKTEAA